MRLLLRAENHSTDVESRLTVAGAHMRQSARIASSLTIRLQRRMMKRMTQSPGKHTVTNQRSHTSVQQASAYNQRMSVQHSTLSSARRQYCSRRWSQRFIRQSGRSHSQKSPPRCVPVTIKVLHSEMHDTYWWLSQSQNIL